MIQPYFDPTNYFQGGSVFSQYLQGFVKERSAMNKQMMEIALAQSDPSFLQDQIQIMNKNIIELEKAKAKALQGDTKYNKQLMSLVTQQMNKESQGKLEVGRELVKRGGSANIALIQAQALVDAALSKTNKDEQRKALSTAFGKASTAEKQTALAIALKDKVSPNSTLLDVIPKGQINVSKSSFLSQGSADRVQMPDARTQTKKALKIMEEIGGGGTMSPQDQAALTAQIDSAIAKYEAQRAGYEQQLADLQEGGVDPFSGFSRNYMLDNPFIQMSRSQGKVDALASAIEAAQQEDFRTPFARVEREAATPRDILSGNVYDEDDEFFGGTFGEYYQKRMSDTGEPMKPVFGVGELPIDADQLAIMNQQGMRQSTTERKPTFNFLPPPEPDPIIFRPPEGTTSFADRRQAEIERQMNLRPSGRDSDIVVRDPKTGILKLQKELVTPTVDFRDLGSDVMGDQTFPEPELGYSGPPAVSMDNRPALAPPVRESNIYDAEPLKPLLDSGDIYYLMRDDEVYFVPRTREAVDALRKQIGREPGPAQTAFEVFPR